MRDSKEHQVSDFDVDGALYLLLQVGLAGALLCWVW